MENIPADELYPVEKIMRDSILCPLCGKDVSEEIFTDDLSAREFEISGLCNSCQKIVFGNVE